MTGVIIKKIPVRYKFLLGLLTICIKKSVRLKLNNLAIYLMSEHHKMELYEIDKLSSHDKVAFFTELMYFSYLSGKTEEYKKPKIKKYQFIQAISELKENDINDIVKCFEKAQLLGAKSDIYKKKVANKR